MGDFERGILAMALAIGCCFPCAAASSVYMNTDLLAKTTSSSSSSSCFWKDWIGLSWSSKVHANSNGRAGDLCVVASSTDENNHGLLFASLKWPKREGVLRLVPFACRCRGNREKEGGEDEEVATDVVPMSADFGSSCLYELMDQAGLDTFHARVLIPFLHFSAHL